MKGKVLYNVTCSVDPHIHLEWLDWMIDIHIPEVLATGMFEEYKILKMLDGEHENSVTYAIQYIASNRQNFEEYIKNHAPELQKKTMDKYSDKVSVFRSLLEIVR